MIDAFLLGLMVGFCLFTLSLKSWVKEKAEKRDTILMDGKKYRISEVLE
jgi:hypothetical protein